MEEIRLSSEKLKQNQNPERKLLQLHTKGLCFLCLTVIDFKTERKPDKIVEDDDNEAEPKAENHSVSLKVLKRYLHLTVKQATNYQTNFPKEGVEPPLASVINKNKHQTVAEVDLCKTCGRVISNFSNLVLSLEKIQLKANYWLKQIHEQISVGSKTPELVQNYSKRMTSDPKSLAQLVIVDNLRKEIAKKSLTILTGSRRVHEPKVELARLKKSVVESIKRRHQTETAVATNSTNVNKTICSEEEDFHHHDQEVDEDKYFSEPSGDEEDIKTVVPSPSSATFSTVEEKDILPERNNGEPKRIPNRTIGKKSAFDSNTGKYRCLICNKQFARKQTRDNHYNAIHLNIRLKCDICNVAMFSCQPNLHTHKKTCRETLERRSAEQKKRENDPRLKVGCPDCGKRFPVRNRMLRHRRHVHLNIKEFACEICKKRFQQFSHRREHMEAIHLGIRTNCEFCDKEFKFKHAYRRHKLKCGTRIKSETEEK